MHNSNEFSFIYFLVVVVGWCIHIFMQKRTLLVYRDFRNFFCALCVCVLCDDHRQQQQQWVKKAIVVRSYGISIWTNEASRENKIGIKWRFSLSFIDMGEEKLRSDLNKIKEKSPKIWNLNNFIKHFFVKIHPLPSLTRESTFFIPSSTAIFFCSQAWELVKPHRVRGFKLVIPNPASKGWIFFSPLPCVVSNINCQQYPRSHSWSIFYRSQTPVKLLENWSAEALNEKFQLSACDFR